ncbi:MAG TPA: DUF4230 domain-containing protein, partial [Planctomycetota bacterium]|nr:DUF4230 domain-containing protein [Planctomycetota bacterium]
MFLAKLLFPAKPAIPGLPAPQPRPWLNRIASPMTWALLAFVLWIPLLVLAYFLWTHTPATTGPKLTYTGPALVFQVQDVGELTTLRYEIQRIVSAEEKDYQILNLPISTEKLTLIVYLTAEFRYDLKQVKPEDITVTGEGANKIVTLRLPPPTLVVNLDTQQTTVYEHSSDFAKRLLNKADPNFETWLRQVAESETRVSLKNGTGPEKARKNAEELLHGLFAQLGVTQVKIETVRQGPADLAR